MIKGKRYVFLAVLFLTAAVLSGCAKKGPSEKIVASINDYNMTVEDFNYESKEVLHTGIGVGDIPLTKEDILDALIIKEVLLQEAQRMDLDKDKDFMKSIELHWEQTLLKSLLTKKSRDIEKKVAVYDSEIADYYARMQEKIKAEVIVVADERAGRRLLAYDGDAAEYARKEAERLSLLYIIPSRYYKLDGDSSVLENTVFQIDKGKDRELIDIDGKWGLIVIEERVPNETEPLSSVREEIKNTIKRSKEREFMNEWIETLRSKASVRINKRVLDDIR